MPRWRGSSSPNPAVVRYMTVRHQKIARSDHRLLRRLVRAVHRDMFAKQVPFPNAKSRRLVLVLHILGASPITQRRKNGFPPRSGRVRQINIRPHHAARAQFNLGVNDCERPDHDGWVEPGARCHDCSWMNHAAQSEPLPDRFPSQMCRVANRSLSIWPECNKQSGEPMSGFVLAS